MTQTHQTPGPQRAKSRSPEYDLARDVLGGLRQDLFHDAFVYRPLRPLGPDSSVAGWFDGRGKWAPHALVVAIAAFVWLVGTASTYNASLISVLLAGLLPALAVVVTLVRPALAFWLALAVAPVTVALGWGQTLWPWSEGSFLAHLVVVTIVGIRTRPRTVAWMWVLTLAFCLLANGAYNRDFGSNTAPMLFVSGVLLLLVTLWHVRRAAKQEVAAERTVTAVERDRRTLLEERTTIARELHDVVAHHMSVVAIQAEAAPYRVENPPPELEQAFVTIRENAVAALTELRRVLGVVRADDYQAPDAPQPTLADLDPLLANVRETGLEVERATTGAVRELPPGVELSAYRIVQEALSNTLRHAPGASARVEVSHVLGGLGLRVVNGPARGMVKPSPGAGHGITGMRERVAMLNGSMTAGELPEGGYEIAVFLPVPPMEETS
ncbi:sensor histidine kinase [Streptomyces uncialis]|uniref:sensor histidine kinase n=1 Tax=Streptomyces uncialis TaxID=1048205 RepID=UPI00381CF251